jgi:DNA-binding transcriptional ArsR family regulator
VGDIVEAFEMTQPTISHHLSVLKQMRLMTARKQGKLVYCCSRRRANARGSPNRFFGTVRRQRTGHAGASGIAERPRRAVLKG